MDRHSKGRLLAAAVAAIAAAAVAAATFAAAAITAAAIAAAACPTTRLLGPDHAYAPLLEHRLHLSVHDHSYKLRLRGGWYIWRLLPRPFGDECEGRRRFLRKLYAVSNTRIVLRLSIHGRPQPRMGERTELYSAVL